MDNQNTILYSSPDRDKSITTKQLLLDVYTSMQEKGYHALDQIVGYILSGDPSYITSHNDARNKIQHIERDELVEELVKEFLKI